MTARIRRTVQGKFLVQVKDSWLSGWKGLGDDGHRWVYNGTLKYAVVDNLCDAFERLSQNGFTHNDTLIHDY